MVDAISPRCHHYFAARSGRPVPDKYAFQATDDQTSRKQKDIAITIVFIRQVTAEKKLN